MSYLLECHHPLQNLLGLSLMVPPSNSYHSFSVTSNTESFSPKKQKQSLWCHYVQDGEEDVSHFYVIQDILVHKVESLSCFPSVGLIMSWHMTTMVICDNLQSYAMFLSESICYSVQPGQYNGNILCNDMALVSYS